MRTTAGARGLALVGVNKVLAKPFRCTVWTLGLAASAHDRASVAAAWTCPSAITSIRTVKPLLPMKN
jgi:hypothetical protein